MKHFSHTINVTQNNNYVINHTECDWSTLRIGSLINIDTDQHFYSIGSVEPFNFIIDFEVSNDNIIVNGNIEEYLMLDDIITISIKEYELLAIRSITNPGIGYKVGNILSCAGGSVSVDIFDNSQKHALLKVEEVNPDGGINKLSIVNKGLYVIAPDNNNYVSGGGGNGACIAFEYVLNPNRKMIDKQVISVTQSGHNSIIEIDGYLPGGTINGKLSFSKYKAFLTSNYVGKTKRGVPYHMNRDTSPHLKLPLLLKGSNKGEEFYNHSILEMDKAIKNLQSQIDELKAKLN